MTIIIKSSEDLVTSLKQTALLIAVGLIVGVILLTAKIPFVGYCRRK